MNFDAVDRDTGEVVEVRGGTPASRGVWGAVGLRLPEGMSFEEWQSVGDTLKAMERSVMWWVGDWLRFGETCYGETYSQALDVTDSAYSTLANAKWVAEKYPDLSLRRENLSWSHHKEAAALDPEARFAALSLAEDSGLSVRDFRECIRQQKNRVGVAPSSETCTVEDLWKLVETGRKYGTFYADPPWLYDNQGTRASTGNHYGGMTVEELCELPIRDLALDDAHLHLWTTNAFIFECPKIFDAWGFEFRSSFVWCKPQMGIGNYWRNSHEFLLTAIRGDAKRFNDKSLMSWMEVDRGRHSAKPEQVRGAIERASTGPYLELFGRSPAPNWAVWGNEVERGLLYRDVAEVA